MSDIPPTDPNASDSAPPPPGKSRAAPWNIRLTIAGALATILLWIFTSTAAVLAFGSPDSWSLAVRYAVIVGGELLLLVAPLVVLRATHSGPGALGLAAWRAAPLRDGLAIGAALWALTLGYERLLKWLAPAAHARMIAEERTQLEFLAAPWPLLVIAALIVAPVAEEVFFRGFIFAGLRGRLGFPFASGLSAAFFALVHWMPFSTVPLFCVGLGCAAVYERHRALAAPLAVHVAYNGVSLLISAVTGGP